MNRIFISSTCFDLIDLRAEIEQELRNMGLNPIMSDRLTSDFEIQPDKNSIETCLINLRQSDAVILILSQRYGPSLQGAGFSNISATHLEYREAVKNKIPIYFYVRDLLEAEFNLYNSSKEISLLKWVKKEDIQIFEFFKEHKKLTNKDMNNWYYSFRDIIDLKMRLCRDLKQISSKSVLEKIIESGQAPCLIIERFSGNILPNSNTLSGILFVKNIGNSVAIQPSLTFYKGENLDEDPLVDDDSLYILETLLPSDSQQISFTIDITSENGDVDDYVELIFEASYATITGHYLADFSNLIFEIDTFSKKIKSSFASYETKKYYHSEAIKRKISTLTSL